LSAGKPRILSIATTLRRSLMANRFRRLLIVGILLFVIAPALVWLLIYSLRGFDYPQQEAAGNESPSDIQQPKAKMRTASTKLSALRTAVVSGLS
jgi:hypothetical protein